MSEPAFPPMDEETIIRLAGSVGMAVPDECMPALLANMKLLAHHMAVLDAPVPPPEQAE